jgi:hypothetical protein
MNRSKKMYLVLAAVLVISFAAVHFVQAVTAEPGSESDPIVSQSYVDLKVDEIKARVGQLVEEINRLDEAIMKMPSGSGKFEVIELKKGQKLIAGASAEIIVRSGTATAIEGKNGDSLADITSDQSLEYKTGDIIPNNHLILVSRDDGRGLTAVSDKVFLLFKGEYTIQ